MEAALGWIGRIFDFLLSLLPHIYTVDQDSRAVVYPAGRSAREVRPGVHWYWPLVTNDPEIIKVSRRTNLLNCQRLTTSDGHTVILSLGVVGWVVDPVRAVMDVEDFDADINQTCLRAATPVVLDSTWDELTDRIVSGDFAKAVKKTAALACRKYGYKVDEVFVCDWCEARVFAVLGDSTSLISEPEDE